MPFRSFSRWTNSVGFGRTKKTSRAAAHVDRQADRRRLRFERLEDRQLLSVGLAGLSAAARSPSVAGQDTVPVALGAAGAGPTISEVEVSTTQGLITWNAADITGVASSGIAIDGTAVTSIYGPFASPPGVNYAAAYGPRLTGQHTYVITATDGAGNATQYDGTFTVVGPTISSVTTLTSQKLISWNVTGPQGVADCSVTIDGTPVTTIYGPSSAPSGVNYSAAVGALTAGSHQFVITAADSAGNESQFTGVYVLPSEPGPTISEVQVDPTQGLLTWNVAAAAGVESSEIRIDGVAVAGVCGPYTDPPGVDYGAIYGQRTSGTHTYVITATDGLGNASELTGTFSVTGPTISGVIAAASQQVITWNVAGSLAVASTSLTIDGNLDLNISGPYAASSGTNYAGTFDQLASGSHMFTITATDAAGNSSQYTGTFVLGTDPGPTITSVVVDPLHCVVSWHASDPAAVTGSVLRVNGMAATNMYGPYSAPPGANYSGTFNTLGPGVHTYVITAINSNDNASHYSGTFIEAGPIISAVDIVAAQATITWNVATTTSTTFAGSAIWVDGQEVKNVFGPYTADTGGNFAGVYGAIAGGSHTYVITATDGYGNWSEYTGTFSVAGPTISAVTVAAVQGLITWNAADSADVLNSGLTIDGTAVANVFGPYAATTGQNYSGAFGTLAPGSHSYVITATDSAGVWSQFNGTFTV